MSSAFAQPQGRLLPVDGQDIIFCHGCGHEWYQTAEGSGNGSPPPPPPTPCPVCHEEFVEVVSRDNDPREFQQTVLPPGFADALFGHGGSDPTQFLFHHPHLHDPDHDHDHNHFHRHHHHDHDAFGHGAGYGHDHDHRDHVHDHDHETEYYEDSDPDEADIEEHDPMPGPHNVYMYRSMSSFGPNSTNNNNPPQPLHRTFFNPTGMPQQQQQQQQPPQQPAVPNAAAMANTVTNLFNGLREAVINNNHAEPVTFFGSRSRDTPFGRVRQTTVTGPQFAGGTTSFTIATGPLRTAGGGGHGGVPGWDFDTLLGNILGNAEPRNGAGGPGQPGQPNPPNNNAQHAAFGVFGAPMQNINDPNNNINNNNAPPPFTGALHHILAMLLSRDGNVAYGDAVHSEEAMDRIITMLMETNGGGAPTGAPPASQSALDRLERRNVDAKILGAEGRAECTICIAEVQLDEEVLFLPCKHWFHEECVVMWLKQHNTCPVCRTAVEAPGGGEGTGASAAATNNNSNSGGGGANASAGAHGTRSGFSTANANAPGAAGGGGTTSSGAPRGRFPVNVGNGGSGGANHMANSSVPGPGSAPASGAHGHHAPVLVGYRQMMQNHERLNAIRTTAGLPPFYHYRSSRVPERSSAAERERERRRRDSHSPTPGRTPSGHGGVPSDPNQYHHHHHHYRYHVPGDYDAWPSHADNGRTTSSPRTRHQQSDSRSPSTTSTSNSNSVSGSGSGSGSEQAQRGWDSSNSSGRRWNRSTRDRDADPSTGSSSSSSNNNGNGDVSRGIAPEMLVYPPLERSNTNASFAPPASRPVHQGRSPAPSWTSSRSFSDRAGSSSSTTTATTTTAATGTGHAAAATAYPRSRNADPAPDSAGNGGAHNRAPSNPAASSSWWTNSTATSGGGGSPHDGGAHATNGSYNNNNNNRGGGNTGGGIFGFLRGRGHNTGNGPPPSNTGRRF
ncbi:ring finger domain protein [Niveomyces insectorum RCEF 264]|uniref:RING-type E3 ubiquitin transferase n=1 Tax=Niveomyces insectorum RCEF 264 TaxID=1081102 RepID=A0A167QZ50_9HYPO|nr:ring finger domain protein [Niveomyces insectorum RCEF 264]